MVRRFWQIDYNLNAKNQIFGSDNYDLTRKKLSNQTFGTFRLLGANCNGSRGRRKIQAIIQKWLATISD